MSKYYDEKDNLPKTIKDKVGVNLIRAAADKYGAKPMRINGVVQERHTKVEKFEEINYGNYGAIVDRTQRIRMERELENNGCEHDYQYTFRKGFGVVNRTCKKCGLVIDMTN